MVFPIKIHNKLMREDKANVQLSRVLRIEMCKIVGTAHLTKSLIGGLPASRRWAMGKRGTSFRLNNGPYDRFIRAL